MKNHIDEKLLVAVTRRQSDGSSSLSRVLWPLLIRHQYISISLEIRVGCGLQCWPIVYSLANVTAFNNYYQPLNSVCIEILVFIQALEIKAVVRLHGYWNFAERLAVTTSWLFGNKWNRRPLLRIRRDEWMESIQTPSVEKLGGPEATQNSNTCWNCFAGVLRLIAGHHSRFSSVRRLPKCDSLSGLSSESELARYSIRFHCQHAFTHCWIKGRPYSTRNESTTLIRHSFSHPSWPKFTFSCGGKHLVRAARQAEHVYSTAACVNYWE